MKPDLPLTAKEWDDLVDANPYLTDDAKIYIKAQNATKKTNNEEEEANPRDPQETQATE
jgi:hypothetical protein